METLIRRKMEKISWTCHVSNEELLQRVHEKRPLVHLIRELRAKWTGHVTCSDMLLKDILEDRMKEKKQRKPGQGTLDWMTRKNNR